MYRMANLPASKAHTPAAIVPTLLLRSMGPPAAVPVGALAPAPKTMLASAAAPHQSPTLHVHTALLQSQTAATEAQPGHFYSPLAFAAARHPHHQLALSSALQGLTQFALPGYGPAEPPDGAPIGEGYMGWEDQLPAGGTAPAEPLVQLDRRTLSWPLPESVGLQRVQQGIRPCARPPARCSLLLSKGMSGWQQGKRLPPCILAPQHESGNCSVPGPVILQVHWRPCLACCTMHAYILT